jgi:outer membrane protein, multidrug efflux system
MKPYLKTLYSMVLLVMLPSCAVLGVDYKRPDSNLPESYKGQEEHSKDVVYVEAPNEWWTLYKEPTLDVLIESAFKQNTNIQLAVARIEEADARMREAGASVLPIVGVSADASRRRVTEAGQFPVFGDNPISNYNLALNSSIELDFWGRFRRQDEAARADYLSTKFAKDTVAWSLSSLVANNYLTIRGLDSQLAVTLENLKISEESLALTKRRQEGGIVSALDVHQAELLRENLKSQILELERLRALAEHQLAVLTGQLDLTIDKADVLQLPIPPIPPAGLPSSLLEARPDVQQAEQAMIAANANIGAAKAALYPSISLTGSLGGESLELGNVLKSAARIWTLGVNLNLPIFNKKLDARVDQATAKQKQALASYQGAVQTAFQEVNDALVNLRQYKAREEVAHNQQTIAKKILEVSQNRYQAGYSGYIDVLDAQRSHQQATQTFVQSRQAVLTASVSLFKALGTGWQLDNNLSTE